MKKGNVYELNAIFTSLKRYGSTKFKYSVLKNIEILKPHISALAEIEQEIKSDLKGFDEDRNELIMRIGTKNADGTVSVDPTNAEVFKQFNEEIEKLVEKHKTSIDSYNKKFEAFQAILDEDLEETLTFRKLDINDCPDSDISTDELEKLITFDIIV